MAASRTYWLTSQRLGFSVWNQNDGDLAFQLYGEPRVTQFISKDALPRSETDARLAREMDSLVKHKAQYYPIFELASGKFVGACGMRPWGFGKAEDADRLFPNALRGGGDVDYECGIHILPAFWGHKFAVEALTAVLATALEKRVPLAVNRVLVGHHPENVKTVKLLPELGFRRFGATFYPPTQLMHPVYVLCTIAHPATNVVVRENPAVGSNSSSIRSSKL